ncbi:MAG TPA: formamidopyrimidine-DNA glycosylase, partial [candidate division Zixibacteria bacterium]|nr:formamidopyrimidine-DNA glycosylase [candidate division Zixibacteria bacterium]
MPELPEVETIVRDLREDISGRKILSVNFITRSVWREQVPSAKFIVGAAIERLDRMGKNILIFLSNDRVLIVHLKMTGRLTFEQPSSPKKKHTHFILSLDGGELRFNDIRRFGYLDLVAGPKLAKVRYLARLGPDALKIGRQEFTELIRGHKRIIKALLLDQDAIAGMGNIYTDEALFRAGIHPKRVSSSLSVARAGKLHEAMLETLNLALSARGSTIDNYVGGRGTPGSFQDQHLVYGREGKPCPKCGRAI